MSIVEKATHGRAKIGEVVEKMNAKERKQFCREITEKAEIVLQRRRNATFKNEPLNPLSREMADFVLAILEGTFN